MAHSWVHCQRSYSWVGRISGLIIPTYLQFLFFRNSKGLSLEPPRQTWYICTVVTIWIPPRLFLRWFDPFSILFDDDSGHEGHSGELPLFEGYYMIQSLISSAYLLQIFHCPWRPAKPRTGMSFFKQFSNNFPTKLSVSQSMSLHDLYGCRNLFGENHFDFSRLWSSHISCQV